MAGRLYTQSNILLEDRKDPNWRAMTNPVTAWMNFTGDKIIMNGIPATNHVLVGYIERPVQMVDPGDTPDSRLPDYYHPIIKYLAAAYLLRLAGPTQDRKKADELERLADDLMARGETKVASPTVEKTAGQPTVDK